MPRALSKKRAYYGSDPVSIGSKRARTTIASAVKKEIRRAMPSEIKYADYANTVGTPVSLAANTLSAIYLNPIQNGDDNFERIGQRISPKSLEVAFSVYQAAAGISANVQYLVVVDTQNQGAAPTTTELLDFAGALAMPSVTGKPRFKILKKGWIPANFYTGDSDGGLHHFYINLEKAFSRMGPKASDRMINFQGTGSTVASASKNAMFLCFISDVAITAALNVGSGRAGLDLSTRLGYTDD